MLYFTHDLLGFWGFFALFFEGNSYNVMVHLVLNESPEKLKASLPDVLVVVYLVRRCANFLEAFRAKENL